MRIWNSGLVLKDQKNHQRSINKKKSLSSNNIKLRTSKQTIKGTSPPSISDIRNKLNKKFGEADSNGEYRISNNKVLQLAKKTKMNTFKLQAALSNGSVNFSEKEKQLLSMIINKNKE